jgi:hypothetical protein
MGGKFHHIRKVLISRPPPRHHYRQKLLGNPFLQAKLGISRQNHPL